jgi:putative oxidoreductase
MRRSHTDRSRQSSQSSESGQRSRSSVASGLALFALRGVLGGSLVAHGSQKLFGAFEGEGLANTAKTFDANLALEPEPLMATVAGVCELGGGALVLAGLGGPVGPAAIVGTMTVAARTAHAGKPYFAQRGGPELAITDAAIATALGMAGFGRFSLDGRHRAWYPVVVRVAALAAGVAGGAWIVSRARSEQLARERAQLDSEANSSVTAGSLATERVRQSAG